MTAGETPLERARRACLSLPEATEQVAWGEPTWRVKKKIFAMFARVGSHHTKGRGDSLWVNAPLGVQEILIHSDPVKFFSPPYSGVNGWVGVVIEEVDDAELRSLAIQSYCMIAPKKLAALADSQG
jgi:hypothetical protein